MTFFDKELIHLREKMNILWNLTDDYFNKIITSIDFKNLLNNLLTLDEYDNEIMTDYNYIGNEMQSVLNTNPVINYPRNISHSHYDLNPLHNDTQALTNYYRRVTKGRTIKNKISLFAENYTTIYSMDLKTSKRDIHSTNNDSCIFLVFLFYIVEFIVIFHLNSRVSNFRIQI